MLFCKLCLLCKSSPYVSASSSSYSELFLWEDQWNQDSAGLVSLSMPPATTRLDNESVMNMATEKDKRPLEVLLKVFCNTSIQSISLLNFCMLFQFLRGWRLCLCRSFCVYTIRWGFPFPQSCVMQKVVSHIRWPTLLWVFHYRSFC